MGNKAYLDAGILTLYLAKNCPQKINVLMASIKAGTVEAPVLTEAFSHICKLDGIDDAKVSINSLLFDDERCHFASLMHGGDCKKM
jgi:hypothetical protein